MAVFGALVGVWCFSCSRPDPLESSSSIALVSKKVKVVLEQEH
jgi:hypothetical protein